MGKGIITSAAIKVEKQKFHQCKNRIQLENVDIKKYR